MEFFEQGDRERNDLNLVPVVSLIAYLLSNCTVKAVVTRTSFSKPMMDGQKKHELPQMQIGFSLRFYEVMTTS